MLIGNPNLLMSLATKLSSLLVPKRVLVLFTCISKQMERDIRRIMFDVTSCQCGSLMIALSDEDGLPSQ